MWIVDDDSIEKLSEEKALSECPFCGSADLRIPKVPAITKTGSDFIMLAVCVSCNKCGADGPKRSLVLDVIKAWNLGVEEKDEVV